MFIDLYILRTKIKIRNTTANNIVEFFTLFNTNNKNVTLNILITKKKTAHAYFERLLFFFLFLSFLAGKLRHFEQLLIASKNKFKENWRMRNLSTPYFFLSFLAGKLQILNRGLPRKTWARNNIKIQFYSWIYPKLKLLELSRQSLIKLG